jgi:mevalonate kinase
MIERFAPAILAILFTVASALAQQKTVTIATVNNPAMIELKKLSPKFEAANPDIKLNWVVVEENILRQRVSTDISTGSGQFDLVFIGLYETPIFAKRGWLKEMANIPADYDLDDVFKSLRDGLSYQGKLYALPFYGESSLLVYRKDLFDAKGLQMPEQPTYDDIKRFADALTDKSKNIYGITLRGKPGWGENMAYIGTLINTFGGTWFDEKWHPTIDSPEWKKAITFYVDLLKADGPPGASSNGQRQAKVLLKNLQRLEEEPWTNYPIGVRKILREAGFAISGLRLRVGSNLPLGSGLSSSAAFEVATAVAALELSGLSMEGMALAQLCQKAENEFVGVRCGLLDQASSVFGKEDEIILLDFRAITARTVPLLPGVALLLVDPGVPHELTGGEYNERRSQCHAAAAALGVKALRDVTSEALSSSSLDPLIRTRALHITGENERVLAGVAALQGAQMREFGQLMFQSHESSKCNFQNSTAFLDALVDHKSFARGPVTRTTSV